MQKSWTIQKVLNWTVDYFENHNVPEARLSAELLLVNILKCKRLDLYLQFERILTPKELDLYKNLIKRRVKFEPIEYILGEKEFMGLNLIITQDVLIPRAETEILVETVLDDHKVRESKLTVLDVGTGSGAIALSLAKERPRWKIQGIDISKEAIEVAQKNKLNNGLKKVDFREQNAFELTGYRKKKYDIIVTNPPYISDKDYPNLHPQVRDYEPQVSLYAGKDGADFYKRFIPLVHNLLNKVGFLYMEIGYNQKDLVTQLLESKNFSKINFIMDYQKIERIVKAVL
jgi:release factor glutamine methyltransferase